MTLGIPINAHGWPAALRVLASVTAAAVGLAAGAAPGPGAATVRPEHPRIWLTPERLARLRDAAGRETPRWKAVRDAAERALVDDEGADSIPALALAYQVTGDTRYSRKAIAITLATAVPENHLDSDSYYSYRDVLPEVVAGLDWCYDRMSGGQRRQVARWLMDRADEVWPDTNPDRRDGWAVNDPGNNYFSGFMMTWPAALAASGDDPRAPFHLDLAMRKYRGLWRPCTDGWGRGGVFAESTNYDSTHRLALILDAHGTATGEDLVNEPGFDFLHDSLFWRIHSTVPARDLYYPLGDQPRISLGPLSDYDRFRALIPTLTLTDGTVREYGKYWLDHITPRTSTWSYQVPWEFLYYDDRAPSQDYREALPLDYFAPGPGVLLRRSSWAKDATYFGIWAGPLREDHQNYDANGFLIYKRGWLVGNATLWSHSGILTQTGYQNNYTFGPFQQEIQVPEDRWPDEAGEVRARESTPEYTYFAGQAAQAYVTDRSHGGRRVARDYTRTLVYLDPDLFLIHDRIRLVDPSLPRVFHLQSPRPIRIRGRRYRFDNGKAQLTGWSLLPRAGVTLRSKPVRQGPEAGGKPAVSSYRLDVRMAGGREVDRMLNVFRLSPPGDRPAGPKLVQSSGGEMEGAAVGGWLVLFGANGSGAAAAVTYEQHRSRRTRHLLLDLQPAATYAVALTALATGQTTTRTVVSTENGVLRFPVPAGDYRIRISPE